MDEYIPGSISSMLSGSAGKMKKKKSSKTPDKSTERKSVKFEEIDNEEDHKKYQKTPYSEVGKKKLKKLNKKNSDSELKSEKRKLTFDETDSVEEADEPPETLKLDLEVKNPKKSKKKKNKSDSESKAEKRKLTFGETDPTEEDKSPKKFKSDLEVEKPKKSKKKKKKNKDAEQIEVSKTDGMNYIPIESSNVAENSNNDQDGKYQKLKNNKEKPEIDPDEIKKTVFVGNVPINYSREKISSIFSQFGPVHKVRLRCIPVGKLGLTKKEAAIRKEFHPKRNSIAAFVVFKSEEAVPAAVKGNGMLADGHHLRIDVADRKEHDMNRAVFIGNLPYDVEDDEVWEVFEKCGEIENVRIVRDNHTMIGKGFGYVNFESSASVELALELNGQEIRKRKINVQRCTNVKKKKKFNKGESSKSVGNGFRPINKFKKLKKKNKFNGNEVPGKQMGSASQFQGRKAETDKKKKKKHKFSKIEMKKKKFQKLLAPSSASGKNK